MKYYTRRQLFGLRSNGSNKQKQVDPPPIETQQKSSMPQPPSIRPELPQQNREHDHAFPASSTLTTPAISNPTTTSQRSAVAPLPTSAQSGTREIVLSFDDGPSTVATAKILDVLARYRIRTIFFVLGQKIAGGAGRELMIRAHEEGHLIANHTYSHPNLTQIDADTIRWQLLKTEELIGGYAAPGKLMRPPYGAINNTVNQVLEEEGYKAVLWTTATLDWQFQSEEWVEHTIDKIQNGPQHNHILLHDTYRWTADNLERFIQYVQALPATRIISFS